MLGDTAVAVNPEDERYKDLIGKTIALPLTGREIPIIADEYVESEFGTGAVKITPAHDPNDWEIGERHGLEKLVVMNDDATMNAARRSSVRGYGSIRSSDERSSKSSKSSVCLKRSRITRSRFRIANDARRSSSRCFPSSGS